MRDQFIVINYFWVGYSTKERSHDSIFSFLSASRARLFRSLEKENPFIRLKRLADCISPIRSDSKTDSKTDRQQEIMSDLGEQLSVLLSTKWTPIDARRRRKPSRGFESHLLRPTPQPASNLAFHAW